MHVVQNVDLRAGKLALMGVRMIAKELAPVDAKCFAEDVILHVLVHVIMFVA